MILLFQHTIAKMFFPTFLSDGLTFLSLYVVLGVGNVSNPTKRGLSLLPVIRNHSPCEIIMTFLITLLQYECSDSSNLCDSSQAIIKDIAVKVGKLLFLQKSLYFTDHQT